MKIVSIPKFERQNENVAANVIKFIPPSFKRFKNQSEDYFKNPCFDLVYKSKQEIGENVSHIYLVLMEEKSKGIHYMTVTSLECLLNWPQSATCPRRFRRKICQSCLRVSYSERSLQKYLFIYEKLIQYGTAFSMLKNSHLHFDQCRKTILRKLIVYSDIEAVVEKPAAIPNVLQVHKLIAVGSSCIRPNHHVLYREVYGGDCVKDFLLSTFLIYASLFLWLTLHVLMIFPLCIDQISTWIGSVIQQGKSTIWWYNNALRFQFS